MSQSAKNSPQKDPGTLYLEALAHVEKLVQAQPPEEDKSAWRKWARELISYEVKTLSPREKRAPRLTKYSAGAAERFLAVMKVVETTEMRLKNGSGGPSSSGESEPEEMSIPRRSTRRLGERGSANGHATEAEKTQQSISVTKVVDSALNLTDAGKTINYEIPCSRCARAGIACAGKEGRACFTCRAHRQGCDLSSRAIREKEKARADDTDKEKEPEKDGQNSVSTGTGRQTSLSKARDKKSPAKDGEKTTRRSEGVPETRETRPRRAATLVDNPRVGSPKTLAELRPGSGSANSASAQRKRRATDADLSVANSVPPGPSPSKRARPIQYRTTTRRDEEHASAMPDSHSEEVRDALLVCEAAFRQLRKALRL